MKAPTILLIGAGIGGLVLVVMVFGLQRDSGSQGGIFANYTAEVYYSPTCGCCMNYMGYLRSSGLKLNAIKINDVNPLKHELNIPNNLWSCHTTKIAGYFVEGHMPIEAIEKLVQEKPSIDGIALPNMPSGSPGMPGSKEGPFEIYAVKDGQAQGIFVSI